MPTSGSTKTVAQRRPAATITIQVAGELAFLELIKFDALRMVCSLAYMPEAEMAELFRSEPYLLADIGRLPEATARVCSHIQERAERALEAKP